MLGIAMILQRFDLSLEDPHYTLQIQQSLTIKPRNFSIRAKIRPGYAASRPSLSSVVPKEFVSDESHTGPISPENGDSGKGVLILYGSNAGSSESFAHTLGEDAGKMGFEPIIVAPLDDYTGRLSKNFMATVIVTCSYEGKPADNAQDFVNWVSSLKEGCRELEGVNYLVFGCGHTDWVDTYQRIPRLLDERLEKFGATRIFERGEANAAGDFVGDFDIWRERVWKKFASPHKVAESKSAGVFDVEVVCGKRSDILKLSDVQFARVLKNESLVEMDGDKYSMKRHIEIQLPEGMSYVPGSYLQVLPTNGDETVDRALNYFGLDKDDSIVIKKTAGHVRAQFPTDTPVNAHQVFQCYIELNSTASRNQIRTLAQHSNDSNDKSQLEELAAAKFESEIMQKRISMLDLLREYSSIKLPLGTFFEISTPMRVRQYSISSSEAYIGEGKCSLTVAVLISPAKSGKGIYKGQFL